MPRRVRKRAARAHVDLSETLQALNAELPEWLSEFLLYRTHPDHGTAARALLDLLTCEGEGLGYVPLRDTPLKRVWRHHRKALLARWEAEGRKGEPFAARQIDRDPYHPDPRRLLDGGLDRV